MAEKDACFVTQSLEIGGAFRDFYEACTEKGVLDALEPVHLRRLGQTDLEAVLAGAQGRLSGSANLLRLLDGAGVEDADLA